MSLPALYKTLGYTLQFAPVTTIHTTAMMLAVGPMVPGTVKTVGRCTLGAKAIPLSPALDRRARVRRCISSASRWRAPRTSSICTCLTRARRLPSKLCWAARLRRRSRRSAPSSRTSNSGALRALATTGAQRSPLLPDVPTMTEAGYPALEFAEWFGVFVPARTPPATVEALSSALRTALQTKDMLAAFANLSVDAAGHTPADFARQIKIDTDRWAPIVKASGFTPLD